MKLYLVVVHRIELRRTLLPEFRFSCFRTGGEALMHQANYFFWSKKLLSPTFLFLLLPSWFFPVFSSTEIVPVFLITSKMILNLFILVWFKQIIYQSGLQTRKYVVCFFLGTEGRKILGGIACIISQIKSSSQTF